MYVYESVVSLLLSMMCQVERTVSINDDHLMVEEDSKSICVMVEKQRAAAATASTTAAAAVSSKSNHCGSGWSVNRAALRQFNARW